IWNFDSTLNEVNTEEEKNCSARKSTHLNCIRDMAEAVLTGRKPLVDGNEGRKALEIILAIYKSCALGQEVIIP
ncbi:MAG: gfo/Idh/MocA family oxidoreductase, partial [Desulfotomaculaceae bacterium]